VIRVVLSAGERRSRPWLPEQAVLGAVLVGPTGETVRALACGCLQEIGGNPRTWSVAATCPCAAQRAA
jgi:hypothetical protein